MKDQRTDDELNRIIAIWMGWKWTCNGDHEDPEWFWINPEFPDQDFEDCDNYSGDLNAISKAVSKLPEGPYTWWSNNLMQLVGTHLKSVNAGPRERAEALVAVIEQFPKQNTP